MRTLLIPVKIRMVYVLKCSTF